MEYKNIDIATKMKSEIDTLLLEIAEIEEFIETDKPNPRWLFAFKFLGMPKNKTYKGFYCTSGIDLVDSRVFINPREAQAVVDVKKVEIEELRQKIAQLN